MFSLSGIMALSCDVVSRTGGSCDKDNVVMLLSSQTNAHAQFYCDGIKEEGDCNRFDGCEWGGFAFWKSCRSSLDDFEYYDYALCCDSPADNNCTGDNEILRLSDFTNAHVEAGSLYDNYDVSVCYGDLDCNAGNTTRPGDVEILKLSSLTNAHVYDMNTTPEFLPDNDVSLYCREAGDYAGECKDFDNRKDCWSDSSMECTWYPYVKNTKASGGGCCPKGEKWNDKNSVCIETEDMCTNVWNIDNQEGAYECDEDFNCDYCAKADMMGYGFWTPITVY